MPTSKSRSRVRRQWDRANTPPAKARRRATQQARRVERHAGLPEPYRGPAPGTVWREVTVRAGQGGPIILHTVLYIPVGRSRCDQFAEARNGQRMDRMTNATAVGKLVAELIGKPPSIRMLADMQRNESENVESHDCHTQE